MKKVARFLGLQINGLLPFLYPMRKTIPNHHFFGGMFAFSRDLWRYKRLCGESAANGKVPFPLKIINNYPNLYDRYDSAGRIGRHYFFQDIWAAAKVYESGVKIHHDIGSRLDGFISHCLCFTKVVMLDIRPLPTRIDNLDFVECDCTNMTQVPSESISSISSLHAVEHFGLGRYGDPVDPDGYLKVIGEMQRVLAKNGSLYFSVPIGRQRLEFNSHRVFDPRYVVELFKNLRLEEFSAVDDDNRLVRNADMQSFVGAGFSCGLFHFVSK